MVLAHIHYKRYFELCAIIFVLCSLFSHKNMHLQKCLTFGVHIINWGSLYNTYKDRQFDTSALEDEIKKLMMDDDVTNKKGIYFYVLTRNEKYLNIRAFTESQKRAVYERQNGNCPHCVAEHREKVHYELSEMEADHITPWCEGGKTEIDNCQLLCKEHNRRKSYN